MSRQMKKMLIIVGIIFGIIFGWYAVKKIFVTWYMSHYVPPPISVASTVADAKNWQSYLSSVGTLSAINGVDISSEVSGIVREVRFVSGQFVKQNDLLILLDTSVEEAQLKDNLAQLKLAQLNFDRNKILSKKNVVSQSTIDDLLAQLEQAQAGVEATRARIKQKTITAPFNGKIGIRLVDIGEFVSAGTTMVTLQSLDPLYVQFNIPEQYLPNLYLNQPVEVTIDVSGSKDPAIAGKITAINSKVDQTTRNILVQATIPNKNLALLPGMFALVKVWLPKHDNVIILPETAISYSLHGDSVFIIKKEGEDDDGKPLLNAYRQYVTVGERRGDVVSIVKGIPKGTMVVTSGQLKLQNGTHVLIDDKVEL